MKRVLAAVLAAILPTMSAAAQDITESMLFLAGESDAENLSEEIVEKYEALASRPLRINTASRQALFSSGLLSAYQVASILDYRSRSGDILSAAELSLVDGFGEETAEALRPFVSFWSPRLPGAVDSEGHVADGTIMAKTQWREGGWTYGTKAKVIIGDAFEAAGAARTVFADKKAFPPSSYSFHAAAFGRIGTIVIGDFSARFGQGLVLWNGFSMSGVSSVSSFARRPSGISPSWSFSGNSNRGAAVESSVGHFTLSAFAGLPGLRERMEQGKKQPVSLSPGANIAWLTRYGQVSATWTCLTDTTLTRLEGAKASLDWRFCIKGVDIFGEGAVDFRNGVPAGLAGSIIPLSDKFRLAVLCRYYSESYDGDGAGGIRSASKTSDEFGAAAGFEFPGFGITADWASRLSGGKSQLKIVANGEVAISKTLKTKFRGTYRLKEPGNESRIDIRDDFCWAQGRLMANSRVEWVKCVENAWLGYLEGGFKDENNTAWLRFSVFKVDEWEDRIYVYERNAPGNFTVPARYGRGCSLSFYCGRKWSIGRSVLKTWLRATRVSYPWNEKKKPGVTGLGFQVQYEF
jgi:DNA uptake protein ComE-like DNA-binding protein